MRFFLVIVFQVFLWGVSQSQHISGLVIDSASGVALPGATVRDLTRATVQRANGTGQFVVEVQDSVSLEVSFVGYASRLISVRAGADSTVVVRLAQLMTTIDEVSISKNVETSNMQAGMTTLRAAAINSLPSVMGETDVVKNLGTTAGVKQSEGQQGLSVRGGSYDQNLVLLDDATIYNASHLLGFYSVFNTWSVSSASFYKAGMPARLGGRSSSVMQVEARCGSLETWEHHLTVGLLSSNLSMAGPLVKNKVSIAVSGRRSYLDKIILPLLSRYGGKSISRFNSNILFQDYNVKILYRLSSKDRIEVSAYAGGDAFTVFNKTNYIDNQVNWGNKAATARWRHIISGNGSMNTSLSASRYDFRYNLSQNMYTMMIRTRIETVRLRHEYLFTRGKKELRFGLESQFHIYTPTQVDAKIKDFALDMGKSSALYATENAFYTEYSVPVGSRVTINTGLRLSQFAHLGPYTLYATKPFQTDSTYYKTLAVVKNYVYPEPRLSVNWQVGQFSTVKSSATVCTQYSHIVPVVSTALPAEMWLPSTQGLVPSTSLQLSCGYFTTLWNHQCSIDVYWKMLRNIEDAAGNTLNFYNNSNVQELLTRGQGRAWGAELTVERRVGRLKYSLAYTYSRSARLFPGLNNGIVFPDKYDKPHELTLVTSLDITPRLAASALFTYSSGTNITMPTSRYIIQSNIINVYGDKNGFRMPPYHRADISMKYMYIKREKFNAECVISVINVYNRLNPYFMYYEVTGDLQKYRLTVATKQVWLFPVLPSLSFQFTF